MPRTLLYVVACAADVTVKPNAEEVDAVRYVTLDELRDMMKTNSGLLWSPWFRYGQGCFAWVDCAASDR